MGAIFFCGIHAPLEITWLSKNRTQRSIGCHLRKSHPGAKYRLNRTLPQSRFIGALRDVRGQALAEVGFGDDRLLAAQVEDDFLLPAEAADGHGVIL